MDQTTKGNMLIFFGAMLILATFWLIVLGYQQSSPVRIALGVCAAVGAVVVFRVYARSRR